MKLVEHEELEPLTVRHYLPIQLILPRHEQFQHHEVREEDVGRILANALALFGRFLTRVARVCHDGRTKWTEELSQLFKLGVREGVHRIHHDRTRPPSAICCGASDSVYDRHEETQRLARSGARRDDEAFAAAGERDGLPLVDPQLERLAASARMPNSEDPARVGMEDPGGYELVNGLRRLKARVELDEWIGPESSATIRRFDLFADVGGANGRERTGELFVACYELAAEVEDVHSNRSNVASLIGWVHWITSNCPNLRVGDASRDKPRRGVAVL